MSPMREAFKHSGCVEVPNRGPRHYIQTVGTKDGEVYGRVDLFHESGLLGARADAAINRRRADHPLHEELAGEREDDDVE